MSRVQAVFFEERQMLVNVVHPETDEFLGHDVLMRRRYRVGDDKLVVIVRVDAESWPLTEAMKPIIDKQFGDAVRAECEAKGIDVVIVEDEQDEA